MNKKIVIVLALAVLVLGTITMMKGKEDKTSQKITIGLLQTASFPPLDQARDGFVNKLKQDLGERVSIIQQNAEGSLTQAQAIAASFSANKNIRAFYGIATPAVQVLKSQIKDKPIVFSAVTDPQGLHLRDAGTNITGSTDLANIQKQISVMMKLLPNIKKVSILYNPGETNSVILVKKMKEELTKYKILFEDDGVNSIADVAAAVEHAVKNTQVILIPTDNTIASSMPIVKQISQKAHVPLVITWTGEKENVLMQFGVNYYKSGEQAAVLMEDILLNGTLPSKLEVVSPESEIIIDRKELNKFQLSLPKELETGVSLF